MSMPMLKLCWLDCSYLGQPYAGSTLAADIDKDRAAFLTWQQWIPEAEEAGRSWVACPVSFSQASFCLEDLPWSPDECLELRRVATWTACGRDVPALCKPVFPYWFRHPSAMWQAPKTKEERRTRKNKTHWKLIRSANTLVSV